MNVHATAQAAPAWVWAVILLGLPAALLTLLALGAAHDHIRRHGKWKVLWRAATGQHLDGKRRSDATFWHRGTRPASSFGSIAHHRLPWWSRQAGRTRAAFFWAPLLAPLALTTAWLLAPALTLTALAAALAGGTWLGGRRAHRALVLRPHRKHVELPAAHALAAHLGVSPPVVARQLALTPGAADARTGDVLASLTLPDHWAGHPGDQQWVEQVLRQRIPVPVRFGWDFEGHPCELTAWATAVPPELAPLERWADLAEVLAGGVYLLGGGADEDPQLWDSDASDPMLAINGATRRGKTNQLLAIAAQALRRGQRVTYIDPKRVSAQCLLGVPGFVLCNDPADPRAMWAAIRAVRQRMDAAAVRSADHPGEDNDRELLILDEAVQLHAMFRDLWESEMPTGARIGDCPPWVDCRAILHQAGQFGGRLIVAGQDLNDAVLFRSKASFGTVVMCSWSPGQWSRMSDVRPVPLPPTRRGRFAVARGLDRVDWYQALVADGDDVGARDHGLRNELAWRGYALAGRDATGPEPTFNGAPWNVTRVFTLPRALPWRRTPAAIPAVIIGLKAGAAYLGMSQGAFTRARMRTPIPGEFTTDIRRKGHPQPCWQRSALDAWQAQRPLAGKSSGRTA